MKKIIGAEAIYIGRAHTWAKGVRVQIVAIHRGPDPDTREILNDDHVIGAIRANDILEFRPEIIEKGGNRRWSWVTSDAAPEDLSIL